METGQPRRKAASAPSAQSGAALTPGDRFRVLMESVRDYAIVMLDDAGYVETWNEGAARLVGYTADEAIGLHCAAFFPQSDAPEERCEHVLAVAARDGRCEREGWRLRKDGSKYWADSVVTRVHDPVGGANGFVEITRDLSARRAAEAALRESEQRFGLLVASVKDYAIFMLDPDGRVATWNEGARRIKGYAPEEIIGSYFARFYTAEDVASGKCEMELENAARYGRFEDEGWRVRKDGTRFWANVVLTAVRDASGTLVGFAKVTRDLTDRRRAEEERLRLTQAQEAIRLRDEFLSIASHELNTPLTATKMQIDSLLERRAELSPKVLGKLERIGRSITRLSQLIEALLDVSRMTTGRLAMAPTDVDLVHLVREAVERMQDVAAKARCPLTLSVDVDGDAIQGSWDALRIEQVVTNVLANALKYAPGAPVVVALTREGDEAVIRVTDRGAGIPTEDRERVFERFERAVPDRHHGGLGLGLYVSREIIAAHGGTIKAESASTGGASIVVRLPVPRRGGSV